MSAYLDVVTGYLGSGKTTFIGRYAQYLKEKSITFAIIENEFGKAGVDAGILRSTGAEILEISGGCVCCTLKVTLYQMLAELSGKVDRIILEPSGLFCGDDLLDIVNTPDIHIKPGFWLGVIDPIMNARLEADEREILFSEIIHAGAVYVSKTDLTSEECRQAAVNDIKNLLPEPAPEFFCGSDIDFSAVTETGFVFRPHDRKVFDHAAMYSSTCISPKRAFGEKEISEKLAQIYSGSCGEVLRIKGSVLSENGGWEINCSVGSESVRRTEHVSVAFLNIIGKNLSRERIKTILA